MQQATRDQLRRSGLPLVTALWAFGFVTGNWRNAVLRDGDTWWHIATGNWMLAHRALPRTDFFSFSVPGTPWIPHEWLSEIVMATVWDIGGWSLLVVLVALAAAATLWLLSVHLGRFLPMGVSAAMMLIVALGMLVGLLARPHVLALPLIELWVAALVIARAEGRAPAWALVPLMCLWANLHGTFMIGLVVAAGLGLEAVVEAEPGERWRAASRWGLFLAASVGAAMLTANGIEGFLLPFRFLGMGTMLETIAEWRSPDFQRLDPLEIMLLGGLVLGFWRGIKLPIVRLLLVAALVHGALQHVRNEVIVPLIAALLLAPAIAREFSLRPFRPVLPVPPAGPPFELIVGAPAALALVVMLLLDPITRQDDTTTPKTALEHVPEALRRLPVLNEYGFGGYLIFEGVRPFIDGRTDMYGGPFLEQYVKAASADGPVLHEVLEKYAIAWTLLPPANPVNTVLDTTPGWHRLYADDFAVVEMRDDATAPPGNAWIAK